MRIFMFLCACINILGMGYQPECNDELGDAGYVSRPIYLSLYDEWA